MAATLGNWRRSPNGMAGNMPGSIVSGANKFMPLFLFCLLQPFINHAEQLRVKAASLFACPRLASLQHGLGQAKHEAFVVRRFGFRPGHIISSLQTLYHGDTIYQLLSGYNINIYTSF